MRVLGLLLLAHLFPPTGLSAAESSSDPALVEDVAFDSHGVTLSGSVALPVRQVPRAAVVFVHGSGKQTRNTALAIRFARAGIAALVYDKRGAGKSGGEYEAAQPVSETNLSLLADDAVAAVNALGRFESLRGIPRGLVGISQAGWIAPLAAQRSADVKFLVLWSGPVCKVSEEDIFSIYTHDADATIVPSYRQALESRHEPYVWPAFLGADTDSSDLLRHLNVPALWIFSDNDASIPVDLSIARLQELRAMGHRYEYVLVNGAGHNNLDGTLMMGASWIRKLEFHR